MKIHEYQAKLLLPQYGVPVQKGRIAHTPAEAKEIALQFSGPVVVKAQVHSGGKGQGGWHQDCPNSCRSREDGPGLAGEEACH